MEKGHVEIPDFTSAAIHTALKMTYTGCSTVQTFLLFTILYDNVCVMGGRSESPNQMK